MEALKNEDLPVSQSTDEQKQANNSDDHDLYAAFASLLSDQLNVPDVKTILDTQRQILWKLDSTNKNLVDTSQISAKAFNSTGLNDLQSYISILTTMKQDLDFIFRRIKSIKKKLETKHPEKYSAAFNLVRSTQTGLEDDEEEETHYNDNSASQTNSVDKSMEKDRTNSNESSSSATLTAFLQTARDRISSLSGKDIMNGIFSSADGLIASNASSNNANTSTLNNSSTINVLPYIEPPTQNDS